MSYKTKKRERIPPYELIGSKVKVVASKNLSLVRLEGLVVDETMKMLKIMTPEGSLKWVPKVGTTFEFLLSSGKRLSLEGKSLLGRPETRLKK